MARADITEITGRHSKADLLAIALGDSEIAFEVIHYLRSYTRPVDGVHSTYLVLLLKYSIIRNCLHHILRVIKHALNGDVVNVLILQAEHLRTLEAAHLLVRR